MTVVLYTADVGGHDDVQGIEDQVVSNLLGDVEVRTVRFDQPTPRTKGPAQALGWSESFPAVFHPPGLNDRLAGRWYKTHAARLFPDADVTVWVDSCLEVTNPDFVAYVLQDLNDHDLALYRHPDRDHVAQEVLAADTLAKYDGADHDALVETMAAVGFAPDRLWAMTTMARRATPNARLVDHLTWEITRAWSTPEVTALDQLILPYVIAWTGAEAAKITVGTLWDNPFFTRHPHRRET